MIEVFPDHTHLLFLVSLHQSTAYINDFMNYHKNWASALDFQQSGILTSVDSDEHVQPPFKLSYVQSIA